MNWHIHAIIYCLEQVRLGNIKRLIINMPPRSLKSMISSVAYPAFVLGHEPTKRIIVVTYGTELSTKFANDFRLIVTSRWYRNLFPIMRISSTKNTESEVVTTKNGFRLATSVDGMVTGRGGDIIIIDDPLKSIDALSDSKREHVNQWFFNSLLSRLDDKQNGAIVVVMQRLHIDDLTGALLRTGEWTHLNLPAIAENVQNIQIGPNEYHFWRAGEPLHAEREPLSVLDAWRAQVGSDTFAAQYLQSPVPPAGAMIKQQWIRRYDSLPSRASTTHVLQSYDTASKDGSENSYSVSTTWHVSDGKYYLVDVLRGRFDYPTLKARAISHARLHKPTTILIEDTSVGSALIAELQQAGFASIGVKVEQNKQSRMSVQSAKFESGLVFFPNAAPWLEALETELLGFPGTRYNDQVDSISQALGHEIKASGWTAKSLEGYAKFAERLAADQYFGRVTGRPW
jgi:predicted phage terminase large subunit-like protein